MVRRANAIGVVVLLVCLGGFVGSTSGLTPGVATASGVAGPPDEPAQMGPTNGFGIASERFARTTFTLQTYANGSVRWTTRYAKPLNDSEVSGFESFATEFNTTETDLYRGFTDLAEGLARAGTNSTDRTMQARGFARRAYVDRDGFNLGTQGKVEMSFLLTNLSQVDGERVILGDVFDGGLYLKPSQKLVVAPGPGLAFASVDPDPDSRSDPASLRASDTVTWEGEIDFNDERPYIVLAPPSTLATPTTATTTDRATGETTSTTSRRTTTNGSGGPAVTTAATGESESGGGMIAVGVIVLLLGAGTAIVWRVTNGNDEDGPAPAVSASGDSGTASAQSTTDSPSPQSPESAPGGEQSTSSAQMSEEELLTDSDRVQQLLDENGGRMRQSAIVDETDWSKSKVSMLLSDMEDDDEVTKLRVGRENIISLPGKEPEAAGSPFEDQE